MPHVLDVAENPNIGSCHFGTAHRSRIGASLPIGFGGKNLRRHINDALKEGLTMNRLTMGS